MEPLMELVHAVDEKTWSIPSAKDGSIKYTIKLTMETCDCKLRCSTCETCVHMYMCSCVDSTLYATVCKHAHVITMLKTHPTLFHPKATAVCEVD